MKTKKISKKMGLKKETIANLNSNAMDLVRAGALPPANTYGESCSKGDGCPTAVETWCCKTECFACFTQNTCDC